jgi:2-C-methyl-D-erythritol 4-phosphate cytidylyltransferase
MKKYAVIVAGGSGERMGAGMPKQFLLLRDKPLLWHSVQAFLSGFPDIHIILVLPKDYVETGNSIIQDIISGKNIVVTEGGATRFHSVQNGLKLVTEPSVIFVHDGVRCLVTSALIRRCYTQAMEMGSAVPAVAAIDSIRIVNGNTHEVADRSHVRIIQTPQTFLSTFLLPAFSVDYSEAFTDEATVVEASGKNIFLIEGEYENIKITRPADLLIAEKILAERSAF